MNKAKDTLGEIHIDMAYFYYEYANYILKKIEDNYEIFNANVVPNN